MNFVDSSKVSKESLQLIVDDLKSLGAFKEFRPGAKNDINLSGGAIDLQGTMIFQNGKTRAVDVSLRKQTDGTYKITALKVSP